MNGIGSLCEGYFVHKSELFLYHTDINRVLSTLQQPEDIGDRNPSDETKAGQQNIRRPLEGHAHCEEKGSSER